MAKSKALEFGLNNSDFNSEGDYETDLTFCYDDDDEQEVTDQSSDEFSKPENCISNKHVTLNDTLVPGNKRKAKTIFHLDLRKQCNRPTLSSVNPSPSSGPGEYGDGYSLLRKKYHKSATNGQTQHRHEPAYERNNDCSLCRIKLPHNQNSLLILCQTPSVSTDSRAKSHTATIQLVNPTTSRQAFKIYCNQSALRHFTVRPKSGVIPAKSQKPALIKTKVDELTAEFPTNKMVTSDQFHVKFFPAYFTVDKDGTKQLEDRLKPFLQLLIDQSPDLIRTRSIQRIVLRDSSKVLGGFSPSMTSAIPEAMKDQLFEHYSREVLPKLERSRLFRSAELRILAANQAMRKTLRRLRLIRNIQDVAIIIATCAFIVVYIVPCLEVTAKNTPALIKPEGWIQTTLKYLFDQLTG